MATWIDWPEQHDESLGSPPSRQPGGTKVENTTSRPETVLSEESFLAAPLVDSLSRIAKSDEVDNAKRDRFSEKGVEKWGVCLRKFRNFCARVRNFGRVGGADEGHERPVIVRVDFPAVSHPDLIADAIVMELRNRGLKHSNDASVGAERNSVAESNRGVTQENSLTGHGAHCACAPMATTEAATSVVGDIVRDGTDETPGRHRSPVEKSDATGAAAPSRRPHPKPSTESGSDQR